LDPLLSQIVDVEAAGTGHVLVDQQTACRTMPLISQESASGTVGLHLEPKRFEQSCSESETDSSPSTMQIGF